jgi:hypothetical protein
MWDQVFDSYRKACESAIQMQQESFKQWTQPWPTLPSNGAGVSTEWLQTIHKRWLELTTSTLNRNRESLDALSKAGIQALEDTFHLGQAKSPEEYRRMVEELWRKNFDGLKGLFEAQVRDFQKAAESWFEMLSKAKA